MKRLILTLALVLGIATMASAQNYAVVNSEKIFKSIDQYNQAITQLDQMANDYQKQVDAKFERPSGRPFAFRVIPDPIGNHGVILTEAKGLGYGTIKS